MGRDTKKKETLDGLLTHIIAEKDGVSEAEVTVEYIRQQRSKRFYPTTKYNIGSSYGGYNHGQLESLNRQEIDRLIERANEPVKH